MTEPRKDLHLAQQMLQNLEQLKLPIEQLRKRIEEELKNQSPENNPDDGGEDRD